MMLTFFAGIMRTTRASSSARSAIDAADGTRATMRGVSRNRLTSSDTMFLYLESRETMMHVAGLLTFTPPPDTPPDHLRRLVDEIRAAPVVHRPWCYKLRTPDLLINPLQA